jgi:hypothetical protein
MYLPQIFFHFKGWKAENAFQNDTLSQYPSLEAIDSEKAQIVCRKNARESCRTGVRMKIQSSG